MKNLKNTYKAINAKIENLIKKDVDIKNQIGYSVIKMILEVNFF